MVKIVENIWAVGAPPYTQPGELTALPDPLTDGKGLAAPTNPIPLLSLRPRLTAWLPMKNPGNVPEITQYSSMSCFLLVFAEGRCAASAVAERGSFCSRKLLESDIVTEVAYRRTFDVRSPMNLHRRRRSPSRASAGSPMVPGRWTVACLLLLLPQALVTVR